MVSKSDTGKGEKMQGDPYSRLLEVMRDEGAGAAREGALQITRGTILASTPLTLDVDGTTQEAERVYISARLLEGHTEPVSLSGLTCATGAVDGSEAVLAVREPVLKAGDTVLLLTEDNQTFYLMDKVVQAT